MSDNVIYQPYTDNIYVTYKYVLWRVGYLIKRRLIEYSRDLNIFLVWIFEIDIQDIDLTSRHSEIFKKK